MYMERRSEILRNWPGEGAREQSMLVQQGTVVTNGDLVAMQPDGTVARCGATTTRKIGVVVFGNDEASGASADGQFMTPQPAQTITAMTWAGGVVSVTTTTNHGYATGNIIAIAGVTPAGYNGSYVITVTSATTFTYLLAANPGAVTVQGTATQTSTQNNSGKALVLWGNYVVKTQAYAPGAYVPGSPVTAANGLFQLANGTTDPEVGFVLSVQAATTGINGQTAHIIVSAY